MVMSQTSNLSRYSAKKVPDFLSKSLRHKAKKKTDAITDDQRKAILAQGEEG